MVVSMKHNTELHQLWLDIFCGLAIWMLRRIMILGPQA